MDLLLTHGYYLYEDPHELQVMKPYPPLGLLYIASHLKARGFDVEVFDTTFKNKSDFEEHIRLKKPPIVGMYCNLMTRRQVIDMIQLCKAVGSTVVLGGPEPANYVKEYLACGADVVVIGEGEITLEELIPCLEQWDPAGLRQVQGIAFQLQNGHVIYTNPRPQIDNLDLQPFPDREAIDLPAYVDVWRKYHGAGSVSLITARGCPYKCKWCSHGVFGYTHRRRSPENVADELEDILERFRPEMVWYADDVFTIAHRWLFRYAEVLSQRGLHAPFETISREDRLDERVVRTLAEMGCYRLWLGSESGSQQVLDGMLRQTDAARTREMAHLLKRYGIQAGMFIMLGYEGETIRDIEETVEHLKAANPDVFLTTIAYPIKGTPFYDEVADRVIPLKTWKQGSDRDLTVAGRYSRRFYRFATRWMVNEVAIHQHRSRPGIRIDQRVRQHLNARIGRIGMLLSQFERENG